jgi:hypothetical protein
MFPFPDPNPDLLVDDLGLGGALSAAYAEAQVAFPPQQHPRGQPARSCSSTTP